MDGRKAFYRLSDEDWKYFTEDNGFIAIPVWGGYVLKKPGYNSIILDHSEPKLRLVTDSEIDQRIQAIQEYGTIIEVVVNDEN